MMLGKFLWYLLLDTVVMITGLILAPIISLFVDRKGNLPGWLYWFQTPDSNMWGDPGDAGFYEDHVDDSCWWTATLWQWRNTTQGFSTFVLGLDETGLTIIEIPSGRGYWKSAVKDDKQVGFEWKIDLKYPFIEKRFVIRMGWKFGWDERFPAQFAGISIRPWQSM
ncbi:hypothetical protein LJC19_04495 [Oxalobacter sp. OttesenSCG-928-P03]|nr:hypothetical protein [Oxalobacter sp. OttesenSCG-928-P03]